jgi:hypothetical protein
VSTEPDYDNNYYKNNGQDADRIALVWYARLIKTHFQRGPILEFGAGVGHLTKRIPTPIYAFEINGYAKSKILKNAKLARVIEFEEFEVLHDFFCGIVSLHVFEHLTESEVNETIELFHKLLSDGGRVLISTPALNGFAHKIKGDEWIAFKDRTHINLKSSEYWINVFSEKNFVLVKTFSDGFYDFPYGSKFSFKNLKLLIVTLINLALKKPILRVDQGENNIFIFEKKPTIS